MSDERMGEQTNVPAQAEAQAALDRLYGLLEKQLELVHQGRLADAEGMCEQTGRLVHMVVAAGLLTGPTGDDPRECLMQLYQQLCLALTAQSEETSASLRSIRGGKRMLRAYGNHMS